MDIDTILLPITPRAKCRLLGGSLVFFVTFVFDLWMPEKKLGFSKNVRSTIIPVLIQHNCIHLSLLSLLHIRWRHNLICSRSITRECNRTFHSVISWLVAIKQKSAACVILNGDIYRIVIYLCNYSVNVVRLWYYLVYNCELLDLVTHQIRWNVTWMFSKKSSWNSFVLSRWKFVKTKSIK